MAFGPGLWARTSQELVDPDDQPGRTDGRLRPRRSTKPISKGKIENGKFSFKLALKNEKNGKPIDVTCKGSVSGDELKGISSFV